MKDIIILGTGNLDIIRLIEAINENKPTFNLLGFLEKNESKIGEKILGYPICGNDDLLKTEYKDCGVIINIFQTPQLHNKIYNNIKAEYGIKDFPNLIHPSVVTKYVEIGEANIIYETVDFGTHVVLGNSNIIYPNSAIGHETIIGDSNLVAINVTIGARSKVGNCNLFSNSSTLSLGLQVGDNNSIGVGSVVIENVSSKQSLLGNPARESAMVIRDYIKIKKTIKK